MPKTREAPMTPPSATTARAPTAIRCFGPLTPRPRLVQEAGWIVTDFGADFCSFVSPPSPNLLVSATKEPPLCVASTRHGAAAGSVLHAWRGVQGRMRCRRVFFRTLRQTPALA
eukprot:scaffold45520_cov64-Phaeocystis_antarctica.AAC.8